MGEKRIDYKTRAKEEKESIKQNLPAVLDMEENLSIEEIFNLVKSTRKTYILKQLFIALEDELHNLSEKSNFTYIHKIVHYIKLFSKLDNISKIYIYRKAKISFHIVDSQKRLYQKTNSSIAQMLEEVFQVLNSIKAESLTVTKDHYKFMMKFIHEIKDLKDIKELINKYPDFVNLQNDDGTPIISNLIDAFIKSLIGKKLDNNIYLLTYYQAVIEVFLQSKYLVLDNETKSLIENKLTEATNKLTEHNDKPKLLWIKSLLHLLTNSQPLTPDEVMQKYNVYIYTPKEEKVNYKSTSDARPIIQNQKIITIDSLRSPDLDDALNLQVIDNKFHLTGYIADVADLVRRSSRLDAIARRKNTSKYLPDDIIEPMLPKIISNYLCSLLQDNQLRNVIAFHLILNKNGNLEEEVDIYKAAIKNNHRLTYDAVNSIIRKGCSDYELEKMLNQMSELTATLRSKSKRLDPNLGDTLDLGAPYFNKKTNAHRIIEEFMILINSSTSAKFSNMPDIPFFYRVHKFERNDEIARIKNIIDDLYKGNNFDAIHDIIKILSRIMDNAKYSVINTGHEALNLEYYSHITSPIRRYSDLIIQRIMHDFLFNEPTLEKIKYYDQNLDNIIRGINENNFIDSHIEKEYVKSKILRPAS